MNTPLLVGPVVNVFLSNGVEAVSDPVFAPSFFSTLVVLVVFAGGSVLAWRLRAPLWRWVWVRCRCCRR
jgi:hypothetical protein